MEGKGTDEEAENQVKNEKASLLGLHDSHLNVCMFKKK